jgi:hypothetical protein
MARSARSKRRFAPSGLTLNSRPSMFQFSKTLQSSPSCLQSLSLR